jgi:hypothetical protein
MFSPDHIAVAISEAESIPDLLEEHLHQEVDSAKIFLSALKNYVDKTSLRMEEYDTPLDLSDQLKLLLVHMVKVGVEVGTSAKIYTTGDIARFFGVTVATVNNWIYQNRLSGVEKGVRFKQARIPETSIYKSVMGDVMTVKEAAQLYEAEKDRTTIRSLTPCEELQEILKEVIFFEKKYEGQYKNTLAIQEKLTLAEARDANEWKRLLKEIEDIRI